MVYQLIFSPTGGTQAVANALAGGRVIDLTDRHFDFSSVALTAEDVALIAALRNRKFAGVGLDVYEDEDGQVFEDFSDTVLENEVVPILLSFPNVVITSHQAFFTRTALQSIAIITMENARAYARGEKLVNEVKA